MKNKIIQTTRSLFAQKGLCLTLNDIATEVGLKKQSIYNYFDSKEDLFLEVISLEFAHLYRYRDIKMEEIEQLQTKEKMQELFFSFFEYFRNSRDSLRIIRWVYLCRAEESFNRYMQSIQEKEQDFYKRFQVILKQGSAEKLFPETEHHSITLSFMAILQGSLDMMLFREDQDPCDDIVKGNWEFFWAGATNLNK